MYHKNKLLFLCFFMAAQLMSCAIPEDSPQSTPTDGSTQSISSESMQGQPNSVGGTSVEDSILNVYSESARDQSSSIESTSKADPLFGSLELWETSTPPALCRGWHASPVVGSGYADRFLFESGGVFYFSANEILGAERIKYMDGEWYYQEGMVSLTVKRKIVLEGGTVIPGWGSMLSDIEGGEYVKYELKPFEYESVELTVLSADAFSGSEGWLTDKEDCVSIFLGEIQFWSSQMGSADNYGGVHYLDMQDLWEATWERS